MWLCSIFAKIRIRAKKRRISGIPANPKTIGEHIRKVRLERGLLQKDLAKILKVSEDSISKWENNKNRPRKSQFSKIEDFLNCIPE